MLLSGLIVAAIAFGHRARQPRVAPASSLAHTRKGAGQMAGQVAYMAAVFAIAIVFVVGPEFVSWARQRGRAPKW